MDHTRPPATDLPPSSPQKKVVIHIRRIVGDQETEEILHWPSEDVEVVIRSRRKKAA
jgi:hypothetical protein